MDLFLSWSTDRSKELASIFNDWIKMVIPQLDVYYSPKAIKPGDRWSDNIKDGLKGNTMGLFFVVKENIVQPWLNFEAGAISNQVGTNNVIPILHDLEPSVLKGPLTQFQAISYKEEDLKRLVETINDNITDSRRIEDSILNDIFNKWYPDFHKKYEEFKSAFSEPDEETSEPSGVLDEAGQYSEILSILRSMEREVSGVKSLKNNYEKKLHFQYDRKSKGTHYLVDVKFNENEINHEELIDFIIDLGANSFGSITINFINNSDNMLQIDMYSTYNPINLLKKIDSELPVSAKTSVQIID